MTTPIYSSVIAKTGIDFEATVKRCSSLATFNWDPPVRRTTTTAPRPGQKPANKRKRTAR